VHDISLDTWITRPFKRGCKENVLLASIDGPPYRLYRWKLRETLDGSVWKDVPRDFVTGKYRKEHIYWEEGQSVKKIQSSVFCLICQKFSAFEKRIINLT
jgi:hypothetical protein